MYSRIDHIRSASIDKISLKTINSCTKKGISSTDMFQNTISRKLEFGLEFGDKNKSSLGLRCLLYKQSCTLLQTIDSGSRKCGNSAIDNDSTSMLKNSIMCSSNNVFLDDFNWPINDFEYLEVIEEKIRDTLRYADLSNLGGNSIKAIIKRILFLVRIIPLDAVKNQNKVKNVDQNEMEERLKYHLAQALFIVYHNTIYGGGRDLISSTLQKGSNNEI
ncbi:DUF4806 domain-containing protein [Aphis craccivora]|uniref:DUF4806 domain-containing protein n=1 Tax=Aphis craccivora TaxID=307492 RepID=A0A6G0ZDB1_APHCR|nr:DUF4806 domain-containing protein [Aphis craccivora]